MKIELENTFAEALKTGINVFTGAGFSILASDNKGQSLPLGSKLAKELCAQFNCVNSDLVKLSTILERTKRTDFYNYLSNRFDVIKFDPIYLNINDLNIKNIFTTNIDNLIPKIIAESKTGYLHNQNMYGASCDPVAINYLPLHGNIDNKPHQFIFSSTSLATTYNDANRIWNHLSHSIETYPTIFIGYSLSDSSTIQALFSKNTYLNAQKEKWIVLHPSEPEHEIEYIKSLGFNVINADLEEFLNWIPLNVINHNISETKNASIADIFKNNIIPKNKYKLSVTRPIVDFFKGASPNWNDIFSNMIHKTSYVKLVENSIFNQNKNTILIGAPVSGKSTVMMQVASEINFKGEKLIFEHLTQTKVEYIVKILAGSNSLIFIENFTDDVEAFLSLCNHSNITVVGVDRGHYFGHVSHFIPNGRFEIINITEPNEHDLQSIYDSLPSDLKKGVMKKEKGSKYDSDTIFEFVNRNITGAYIADRYKGVLKDLDNENGDLAEFLVLCAYAHSCRIPLSSEMAISYFSDTKSHIEVLEMREHIKDIIIDYPEIDDLDDKFEYYYPKSFYIAESIMKQVNSSLLRDVMWNVIKMISPIRICNYNVFKRYAFDKRLALRAFKNWEDGKDFYEAAFKYDYGNAFILQQGALYLSSKKQFNDAFTMIDKAINISHKTLFSIQNSHAIILFDANIQNRNPESREQLDRSMEILQRCIKDDKRKTFHAIQYSSQAIQYSNLYHDEKALQYLRAAHDWMTIELRSRLWDREIKHKLSELKDLIALF